MSYYINMSRDNEATPGVVPLVGARIEILASFPEADFQRHTERLYSVLGQVGTQASVEVFFEATETLEDPEQTRLQEVLSKNMLEVLGESSPKDAQKLSRMLDREGLNTLRDVLVAGKDHVTNIRNLGPGIMSTLETTVSEAVPTVEWRTRPTATEIAGFCRSVNEISSSVLGEGLGHTTVQDVLLMSDTALAQAAGIEVTVGKPVPDYVRAFKIRREGHKFLYDFVTERRRLAQQER